MLGGWKCTGAILQTRSGPRCQTQVWHRFWTKKIRRAGCGFVHRTTRLSASALAGFLVRPIGSASTYSRAALGAIGNLGGGQGPCKGCEIENVRILRILNNQHFHSGLCSLWIRRSLRERRPEEEGDTVVRNGRPGRWPPRAVSLPA